MSSAQLMRSWREWSDEDGWWSWDLSELSIAIISKIEEEDDEDERIKSDGWNNAFPLLRYIDIYSSFNRTTYLMGREIITQEGASN